MPKILIHNVALLLFEILKDISRVKDTIVFKKTYSLNRLLLTSIGNRNGMHFCGFNALLNFVY